VALYLSWRFWGLPKKTIQFTVWHHEISTCLIFVRSTVLVREKAGNNKSSNGLRFHDREGKCGDVDSSIKTLSKSGLSWTMQMIVATICERNRVPQPTRIQQLGHALVKPRGFLGSVCVWWTSLLWCFDMCYWRPLFLARPATNLVSKFLPVPL